VTAIPPGLPGAETLIALVREARRTADDGPESADLAANKALDAYIPDIDELGDAGTIAGWLGIKPQTIYVMQKKPRLASGYPGWPDPDDKFGRSKVWRYRTIVLFRAGMPGFGAPGHAGDRARNS
jgi:hypothetical protein